MKQSVYKTDDVGEALSSIGLDITDSVLEQCLDFWELLSSSSRRLNLISKHAIDDNPIRHIGDSLAPLVEWLPQGRFRMLDVGSGGGLPAIPLTLARPELETTLLESREKKADWLAFAIRRLGLEGRTNVIIRRIESLNREDLRGYDFVTARAVAAPARLLKWMLPRLDSETLLLLWHSDRQHDEILDTIKAVSTDSEFKLSYTLSYVFRSICFSSNISSICKD